MLEGSCDCGAVRIELDDAPDDVTNCNCGICRRYGALWSYFHPDRVRLLPPEGATAIHKRGKRMLERTHYRNAFRNRGEQMSRGGDRDRFAVGQQMKQLV
jgi:hypothetical protein